MLVGEEELLDGREEKLLDGREDELLVGGEDELLVGGGDDVKDGPGVAVEGVFVAVVVVVLCQKAKVLQEYSDPVSPAGVVIIEAALRCPLQAQKETSGLPMTLCLTQYCLFLSSLFV